MLQALVSASKLQAFTSFSGYQELWDQIQGMEQGC